MEVFIDKAKALDIEKHLQRCSGDFIPPLETYVDIAQYSNKIRSNATTVEAWVGNNLIGVIGIYINDEKKESAFITSVSVERDYSGIGLAKLLLGKCIELVRNYNYHIIKLEVNAQNEKAIKLYDKYGFKKISSAQGIIKMEVILD